MKIKNFVTIGLTGLLFTVSSCQKDVFNPEAPKPEDPQKFIEANTFDFSTIQTVNLSVDYSAFQTYGPVFFSVYNENPFVGEGENEHIDENITPVFEDYTDANGRYNKSVKLPAYAQHLYVVTGNFLVTKSMVEADVVNGVANVVVENTTRGVTRAAARAATHDGVNTKDISKMPQLSFIVDENGNSTGEQIYKEWFTPLGTWDSQSGAPNYLVQPGSVKPELLFTDEELEGLYATVGNALDANKPCNEVYRDQADLTLEKSSEVTITMLGGSTCWNSSLGYYYYTENNAPQSTMDLNIIMLFPNTQDGQWKRLGANQSFNKNIGVNRGDVVQLMYYPNIANGDLSNATPIFPKGIKIGFILKTNAWSMQGSQYALKGYERKYNVWASSTNGASFCRVPAEDTNDYPTPILNGESRSAKFAYKKANGDKYAIVSFEDACNDQDYDDVIFALRPVNAFTPLPEVEDKKTTTVGVYAFEDLWPDKGDYDLNDAVIDFKHEKVMSKLKTENEFKITEETFYLTTYQNYVELTSGLALTLNTPVTPKSIEMKKIAPNSETPVAAEFECDGNVYYLTNDIKGEIGTTYILTLKYEPGQTQSELASVQPFIFRKEADGKNWEVHIPFEAPTAKMNFNYFGTKDDASVPAENRFFVRSGDYPFAYYLAGAKIDSFKNTILKRANESRKINEFYPKFMEWSVSKGAKSHDWYLSPANIN